MSSSIRQIQANTYDVYDNSNARDQNPTRAIITTGSRPATGSQGDIYFDASGSAYWYKDVSTGWVNFNTSPAEIKLGSTTPSNAVAGSIFFNTALNKPVWYNGSSWSTIGLAPIVSNSTPYTPITTQLKGWFSAKDISGTDISGTTPKRMVTWRNISPTKNVGSDISDANMYFESPTAVYYEVSGGYANVRYNTGRGFATLNSGIPPAVSDFTMFLVYSLETSVDPYGSLMTITKNKTITAYNQHHLYIYRNNVPTNHILDMKSSPDYAGTTYTNIITPSIGGPNVQASPAYDLFKRNILAVTLSNSGRNACIHVNGVLVFRNSTATIPNMYLNHIILGASQVSTSHQKATTRFYEMLFYYTDIPDSERQKIEGYLAWNNGVTDRLYAGHPYKNTAPTV